MEVTDWGRIWMSTNSRSCKKGKEGDGLFVAWREAKLRGEDSATHLGIEDSGFVKDAPGSENFHFARIYGEASAYGNLPRQDYAWIQHAKKDGKHHFQMRVWKNKGKGGTKIRVDGNKYCNMMGHRQGMVDYVWTYQGGEMEIYKNRVKENFDEDDKEGFWEPGGTIWTPPREMHRKDLHLADWDGDGDCDIIYVDPDRDNAVEVWLNNFPEKGKWDWTRVDNPAPGVTCKEKRGIGASDRELLEKRPVYSGGGWWLDTRSANNKTQWRCDSPI